MSVRSFTATISMSVVPAVCCASTARKKFRPTRPKPFTPTRIAMMSPREVCSSAGALPARDFESYDAWSPRSRGQGPCFRSDCPTEAR